MDNDFLRCVGCKKNLPVSEFHARPQYAPAGRRFSFSCKKCKKRGRARADEYWNQRFQRFGTICVECGVPKKVSADSKCANCLAKIGWKVCNGCHEKKLIFMDFYKKRATCIDCCRAPVIQEPTQDTNTCVICDKPSGPNKSTCSSCNLGLERFLENPRLLIRAVRYLQRTKRHERTATKAG
jgi:hypothetical protein